MKDMIQRLFEDAGKSILKHKSDFPYPEMVEALVKDSIKELQERFTDERKLMEFIAQTSVVMFVMMTSPEAEQFYSENEDEFF